MGFARRLTSRLFKADDSARQQWVRDAALIDAEELGVTGLEIVKLRGDHKLVLRCESAAWGRCVLKSMPRYSGRAGYRSHVAATKFAHEVGPELFPALYHVGDNLTVEQWIDGPSLKRLPENEWADVDFVSFLQKLRSLSLAVTPARKAMSSSELHLVLESYLNRSFGFLKFLTRTERVRAAGRLYRNRRTIRAAIQRYYGCAASRQIRAGNVIDDLNDSNVHFDRASKRPVIIDSEDLRIGVPSFDVAWLLTTMARGRCPMQVLVDGYEYMASSAWGNNRDEMHLANALLTLLLTIDLLTIPRPLEKTRGLLAHVNRFEHALPLTKS